jgi:hypothetical protein
VDIQVDFYSGTAATWFLICEQRNVSSDEMDVFMKTSIVIQLMIKSFLCCYFQV